MRHVTPVPHHLPSKHSTREKQRDAPALIKRAANRNEQTEISTCRVGNLEPGDAALVRGDPGIFRAVSCVARVTGEIFSTRGELSATTARVTAVGIDVGTRLPR
jgi:hypothetical protein